MVSIDKAVVARLKKEGKNFEILVDCEKALEFKKGKNISLYDILASDIVYKDSRKGEKSSEKDMETVFKTKDSAEVSKMIIKQGEIQISKDIRDSERELKRKKVIEIIHRNCIDSKTGLPHPPQRIENAIDEARVHIDENKTAEEQIDDILDKLKPIIPIRSETKKLEIIIPSKYAGQSMRILKMYGKISKSEWKSDGSFDAIIEIPAGIMDEFFSQLNNICHGEVNSKILT